MRRISASGSFERAVADALPLLLHLRGEGGGADLVHEDLDARLVLVVAPALQIVDAQDGLQVAEQVGLGQIVADQLGDDGRAALAAADVDCEAQPAVGEALQLQADVVHLDGGAVVLGAR